MADLRRTKRKVVGGLTMLSPIERKAVDMAGYACLYFVGHEGDGGTDPIKVGYTHSIFERMTQFRNAGWREPKIHELLYVRGPMSAITQRRISVLSGQHPDIEKSVEAFHKACELDEDTAHIVKVEAAVHAKLKAEGLHHSREWFIGGRDRLVSSAKGVIDAEFGVPCYTHNSMRRLALTWAKEAGM